ncbi:hypothetical protein ACN20G_19290 [Streptomyces sp. BI20]|uniref:hypothetical protein n=1 Tax=Streptomyces sp. BI20 TaxID=3403460 RepID=UPI003C740F7A
MGGRPYTRGARRGRPVALACAVVALFAALLLCARPGTTPGVGPALGAGAAPFAAGPITTLHGGHDAGRGRAAFLCPDGGAGCSPLAHVTAGVLPAPPPGGVLGPAPAVRLVPAAAPRPPSPARPRARGPDLHVLQVLRS